MPRRATRVVKRIVPPDAKYSSLIVTKFINKVMLRGQKATAERIVYDALLHASQQLDSSNPAEVLEQAIKNATPLLMVRPRRVGGATYQVPVEVEAGRGQTLAMRWLITAARARSGKSMAEKLAAELVDAIQGRGATIKRREDVHKMAQANKAFVHYRW
jgi:small subunit ribosomal protein S7